MNSTVPERSAEGTTEATEPERRSTRTMVRPATDVVETDHAFEVLVDLPGCRLLDISVAVGDDVLEVDATRRLEQRNPGDVYLRNERVYGSVSRAYAFPCHVDPIATTATCGDGVLRVRIPKAQRASPLRVEVPIAPAYPYRRLDEPEEAP